MFIVTGLVYVSINCNRSGLCVYSLQYEWSMCIFTVIRVNCGCIYCNRSGLCVYLL